jgi:hypothetical protein
MVYAFQSVILGAPAVVQACHVYSGLARASRLYEEGPVVK